MMAKTRESSPSEQLQALIAERQRYESWLSTIAARREAAPAHVVARVEEDYRARLGRIGDELAARAGELRDRIAALSDRLAEVKLHEATRRDEKAEAELRTAVGEYSPGQWSEISEAADRDLSTFEADRQLIERELNELQGVLQHVSGGSAPAAPVSAPAASGAVSQPDATRTAPARDAQSPAAESRQPPRPAPTPHRPAAAAPAAPVAQQETRATAAPGQSAPVQNPPAQKAPPPETQKRTDASEREGQEKTLLCGECGTANYPTEWYCEACGAELSSM